jgi:hypothetical protein
LLALNNFTMKKIFLLLSAVLITTLAFAQSPQGINYQGVVRDYMGAAISKKPIGVRIQILQSSTPVYIETFSTGTDTFGLYSLVIGSGSASLGSFSSIPWGGGNMSVKVDIDPNGGTAYLPVATSQLMSVPYALYSGSSNGVASITTNAANISSSGTSTVSLDLANIGSGGVVGSATQIPVITYDTKGRITSVSTATFATSGGTVTNITAGAGLTGGSIVSTGTLSLATIGAGGSVGNATSVSSFTYDTFGRITGASNTPIIGLLPGGGAPNDVLTIVGTTPTWAAAVTGLTSVNTNTTLTGNGTVGTPLSLPTVTTATNVGSATQVATFTVDAFGRVTNAANINIAMPAPGVTNIATGTGILGGPITTTGTISADNTTALWNANQLQGQALNTSTATAGQVLTYTTGNTWVPATLPSSLPTPIVGSILYSDASNAWAPTSPSTIFTDGTRLSLGAGNSPQSILDVFNPATGPSSAVNINQNGNGYGINIQTGTSSSGGLKIFNQSTNSQAAYITTQDVANSSDALYVETKGIGNAIKGYTDNSGSGIFGYSHSNSSSSAGVYGMSDSLGSAGIFHVYSPSNFGAALDVMTQGSGYSGVFSGGAGLQTDKIQVTGGSGIPGQVLTSDVSGNATWQNVAGGGLPGVSPGSILFSDPAAAGAWSATNPTGIFTDGTNIGIGTSSPAAKIDILTSANAILVSSTYTAGAVVDLNGPTVSGSSTPVLQVTTDNSTGYGIKVDNPSGAGIIVTSGGSYGIGSNISFGTGNALVGQLTNTSSGTAVWGNVDAGSSGVAGLFTNNNSGNTATTLSVSTNAASGYSGQFSGGKGVQVDKLQITNGAGNLKVLTSDPSGNATWQAPAAGGVTSVTVNSPLNNTGTPAAPVINLPHGDGSVDGYISVLDWNTFNSKLSTVSTTSPFIGNGTGGSPLQIGLNSANIFVGSGTNLATGVAMSGDIGITNTGITSVNKLKGTAVSATAPTAGQVLTLVAGTWTPQTPSAGTVVNVTASSPVVSTGGATPNISLTPGTVAGQVYVTGTSPFTPALVTMNGDATITSGGALTLANVGSATTYAKVTTDTKGRVTGSGGLIATADIGANAVNLTTQVTGILPTANGGMGANMTAGAIGAIPYSTSTTAYSTLAAGGAGLVLKSNGAGVAPSWQADNGVVNSVTASPPLLMTGTVAAPNVTLNGLSSLGAGNANQIIGANTAGNAMEYKTITAGPGISISNSPNVVTINNTGVTTANNGLTLGGSIVSLGGALTAATTITQAANNMTFNATTGNFNINSASTNPAVSITTSGTGSALKLVGGGLDVNGGVGVSGDILTSQGAGAIPKWMGATTIVSAGGGWSTGGNAIVGGNFLGTTNAFPLVFNTNGSGAGNERMRIDVAGNVGIGTNAPAQLLHVYGNGIPMAQVLVENNAGAFATGYGVKTASHQWFMGQVTGPGQFSIQDVTAGLVRMTIMPNGNVGINNTAPGFVLDVTSTSGTAVNVANNATGHGVASTIAAGGTGSTFYATNNGSSYGIYANASGNSAGFFTTTSAAASVYASTSGTGDAVYAVTSGTASAVNANALGGSAVYTRNNGAGATIDAQNGGSGIGILVSSGSGTAISASNAGAAGSGATINSSNAGTVGNAGNFYTSNANNTSPTLSVTTAGIGANAIQAVNTSTLGSAGNFQVTVSTNTTAAVNAITVGGLALGASNNGTNGGAANFQITNGSNPGPALVANTFGTGNSGVFTGGTGLKTDALTMTNTAGTIGAVMISSNTTGSAVWANPVNFSLQNNAPQGVASGPPVVINFPTANYNNGGGSAAGGVYTAPVSGVYHIDAGVEFNAATGSSNIFIYVNNAPVRENQYNTLAVGTTMHISADVFVNAGQTVDIRTQVGGAANTLPNGSISIYFNGHLIR